MIIGYDFFAGSDSSMFDTRAPLGQAQLLKLSGGIIDELNLRNNVTEPYTTGKSTWKFDNILRAEFKNNLESGSIGSGIEITKFIIKKRKTDEFLWIPVCTIEFNNDTTVYTAYDYLVQASEQYEWAVVPVTNAGEGISIILDPFEVSFNGGFISDARRNYRLFYNLKLGDIALIRPNSTQETFSRYPITTYSGQTMYRKSTVSALLSARDDDLIEFRNERILREEILFWLMDGKPKLFKADDGTFLIINVIGTPTIIPHESVLGKYSVSFEYVECADANSADAIIASGLVNAG